MAIKLQKQSLFDTVHAGYKKGVEGVTIVNDCVEGQQAINGSDRWEYYLPNLSTDPKSERSIQNHNLMRKLTQFTNIPNKTLLKLIGSLVSTEQSLELPPEIQYVESNIDGCGTTAVEFVRQLATYILKEKYVGVLSTYNGDTSSGEVIRMEADQLGYASYLKVYNRASILDYDFSVYNGVKKLSYVKLLQSTSKINHKDYTRVDEESLLILGLDSNGQYYQRTVTKNEKNEDVVSEPVYVTANNQNLNDIPFEFISDDSSVSSVPEEQGYLFPISNKCIERYRAIGNLQMIMAWLACPMLTSTGWTDASYKLFNDNNGGSIGVGPGASIQLPIDGDIKLLQIDGKNDLTLAFLRENKKEIQALGGAMPDDETAEETATVAKIKNIEALVVISGIAASIVKSLTILLSYSQMFMSGNPYTTEGVEVVINKDFDRSKLSAPEVREILNLYDAGHWDREEVLKVLNMGNWGITSPEDLENRLQTLS